ncbi:MAG TPA: nucleotidyltransferase [Arcobacter sp.]|nr:nucleotidyltransferase [Arcobacter sp.]HIP55513.1 nucleotidyltransferase [Arcobacter sp.]
MISKEDIILKIKEIKPIYEQEGLVLLGLFGSYAKNEANENSDIDLLYKINTELFMKTHKGFTGFSRILDIKSELKDIFKKNIDLCTINGNSKTFKEFALKEAIYV